MFKEEKQMSFAKSKMPIFFILCVFFLASCSGGGGGSSNDTGTVSMNLMDLPNGYYQAVYITILRVEVHKADSSSLNDDGSWVTIGTPNKIYNLLELVNCVMQSLGIQDITAGKYTQVRIVLGDDVPPNSGDNILGKAHPYANYVIDSGTEIPIKIPSGFNSGIKLIHPFEVESDSYTELILDFDAMSSIVESGNGNLILKPTIKIIEAFNIGASNYAVSGQVTDADNENVGLGGVRVSAQTYDAADEEINEQAATYTDSEDNLGYYCLPVEPDQSYNIVAFSIDYIPQCTYLYADMGPSYSINFSLTPSENNNILLGIDFANGDPSSFPDVTVKFIYLDADCGAGALTDEIQAESIVAVYNTDESKYEYNEIFLPYGNYKLIASAEGYMDFESDAFLVDNENPATPIVIELQEL
jgi:hypothetical protein